MGIFIESDELIRIDLSDDFNGILWRSLTFSEEVVAASSSACPETDTGCRMHFGV